MSILFFPGTLIHELAHAFMAVTLFVRVGKMELFPQLIGNNLKLGSVEVGRSDPFRQIMIGMAPFLIGTLIIVGTFFLGVKNNLFSNPIYIAATLYISFEIGNTMFSSKKDMEGALELLLAVTAISVALYLLGVRLPLQPLLSNPTTQTLLEKICIYLAFPLGIDLVLLFILRIAKR